MFDIPNENRVPIKSTLCAKWLGDWQEAVYDAEGNLITPRTLIQAFPDPESIIGFNLNPVQLIVIVQGGPNAIFQMHDKDKGRYRAPDP